MSATIVFRRISTVSILAVFAGLYPALAEESPKDAGRLYVLGAARVMSMPVVPGAPAVLLDQSAVSQKGWINDGIAIDPRGRHIYWTNMGRASEDDGFIMRSDMTGADPVIVVPRGATFTPKQLKIDLEERKLYWADREGMAIMRSNLDGSDLETLVSTGDPQGDKGDQTRWCVGIAIDRRGGKIYWTQKGGDDAGQGVIRRAGIEIPRGESAATRTDIETLFADLPEPIDLDLDLDGGMIYWTDRGDNTVSRAPMDPPSNHDPRKREDREILVRGLKEAIGVSLDVRRNMMVFTSLGGEIGMSRLDGSELTMLAQDQGLLTGIVIAE